MPDQVIGIIATETGLLIICIIALFVVFTKKSRAELTHMYIAQALDYASNEIYLFNADTLKLIEANNSASNHLGYSTRELNGLRLMDLHPKSFSEKLQNIIAALKGRDIKEDVYETVIVCRDGSTYPVEVTIQYTEEKEKSTFILVVHDVSDRRQAEELRRHASMLETFRTELEKKVSERTAELEAANQQLERANQTKSEFVNVVSHELRTPLTSIKSFAEILRNDIDELDSETKNHFLTIIDDEAGRLTRLINDLLDLQRLDSGRMIWRDTEQDLNVLTRESISFFSAAFNKKGLALKSRLPHPDDKYQITIDPDKLKQVIANLLSNALKFTKSGEVTVTLERVYHNCPVVFVCSQADRCPSLISVLKEKGVDIQPHIGEFTDDEIQEGVSLVLVDTRLSTATITPLLSSSQLRDVPIIVCNESENEPQLLELKGVDDVTIITDDLDYSVIVNLVDKKLMRRHHYPNEFHYQLSVVDQGVGIPEDELDNVFARFHQVKDNAEETGGSGLGLAICREYIEHYQGTIAVESTVGIGSTFNVTLPPLQVRKKRLGEILVASGLVTNKQIEEALKKQCDTFELAETE